MSVPMIPPFITLGKAWCRGAGIHSTMTSPSTSGSGKLRMRSPSAFAGPQPKQIVCGPNRSWRL